MLELIYNDLDLLIFCFVDNSLKDQVVDGWVVSSESCSFNSIGAKYYREVLPGEFLRQYSWGLLLYFKSSPHTFNL